MDEPKRGFLIPNRMLVFSSNQDVRESSNTAENLGNCGTTLRETEWVVAPNELPATITVELSTPCALAGYRFLVRRVWDGKFVRLHEWGVSGKQKGHKEYVALHQVKVWSDASYFALPSRFSTVPFQYLRFTSIGAYTSPIRLAAIQLFAASELSEGQEPEEPYWPIPRHRIDYSADHNVDGAYFVEYLGQPTRCTMEWQRWVSGQGNTSASITCSLREPYTVTGYALQLLQVGPRETPTEWTLLGREAGSERFVVLHQHTEPFVVLEAETWHRFTLPIPTSHLCDVRLDLANRNVGAQMLHLADLKIFTDTPFVRPNIPSQTSLLVSQHAWPSHSLNDEEMTITAQVPRLLPGEDITSHFSIFPTTRAICFRHTARGTVCFKFSSPMCIQELRVIYESSSWLHYTLTGLRAHSREPVVLSLRTSAERDMWQCTTWKSAPLDTSLQYIPFEEVQLELQAEVGPRGQQPLVLQGVDLQGSSASDVQWRFQRLLLLGQVDSESALFNVSSDVIAYIANKLVKRV